MSNTIRDRGTRSFKSHLSRLLHWRYTSPGNAESYPPEQWNHLKSLYDTLLLRVMLDQLLGTPDRIGVSSSVNYELSAMQHDTNGLPDTRELDWLRPTDPKQALLTKIRDMKAPLLCQAVVHSLTRSAMKARHFLSWITGYSACSAAFALAYILVIDPSIQTGTECFQRTVERTPHMYSTVQSSSPFNNTKSENSTEKGFEALMKDALSILDTVGKQFSRLSEYKTVIQALHHRALATRRSERDEGDDTSSEALRTMGPTTPRYMRNLVKAMVDQLHASPLDNVEFQRL
jgi:hypothetical protein